MASALRPGGVLLAEEPWFGAMFGSPTPACVTAWKAFDDAISADYLWAVALPQALHDAGLENIEWRGDAQLIRGGTPEAELLRLSVEAVRERIPPGVEIDAGLEILKDPNTFEPGVVWYSAWGRRDRV
jgi:hypothetical protein